MQQHAGLVAEAAELGLVRRRKGGQLASAPGRQHEALASAVCRVDAGPDQTGIDGAPDELDDGVVPQLQQLGHVADSGLVVSGEASDGEEELVLVGRQPLAAGGVLREPQEHAQGVAQPGQCLVLGVGGLGARWCHMATIHRTPIRC